MKNIDRIKFAQGSDRGIHKTPNILESSQFSITETFKAAGTDGAFSMNYSQKFIDIESCYDSVFQGLYIGLSDLQKEYLQNKLEQKLGEKNSKTTPDITQLLYQYYCESSSWGNKIQDPNHIQVVTDKLQGESDANKFKYKMHAKNKKHVQNKKDQISEKYINSRAKEISQRINTCKQIISNPRLATLAYPNITEQFIAMIDALYECKEASWEDTGISGADLDHISVDFQSEEIENINTLMKSNPDSYQKYLPLRESYTRMHKS